MAKRLSGPPPSLPQTIVDGAMMDRVEQKLKAGVWVALTGDWTGLEVKMRPFWAPAVQARRDAVEAAVLKQSRKEEFRDLGSEDQIRINSSAAVTSLMAVRGVLRPWPALTAAAEGAAGVTSHQHPGGEYLELDNVEEPRVREALIGLRSFRETYISTVNTVADYPREDLDALGESSALGLGAVPDERD